VNHVNRNLQSSHEPVALLDGSLPADETGNQRLNQAPHAIDDQDDLAWRYFDVKNNFLFIRRG